MRPILRVCCLGTAGYHPNATRHTSCYMLPELGFVLDAGTGFFRVRDYLATNELHVFLSHAHLDHVIGLSFLLDVLYRRSVERVLVHGLADHLDAVRTALLDPRLFPAPLPIEYQPAAERFSVNGVEVATRVLHHPGRSLGYRFRTAAGTLAYITDTTASTDYLDFISGVDVLLHEANFPDAYHDLATKTGHSCVGTVLRLAAQAQVKRLVLTHVNPLLGPADPVGLGTTSSSWSGVMVAMDGLELAL